MSMTISAVAPTADASASAKPASELTAALAATALDDPARPALRERCIEAWLPLAQHLARRYANRGEPLDDLTQVAMVGLIKSVDRYQADRGVEFSGFAIPTIVGELKRHFRDRTWSIRVPRRLQELRMAIVGANNALTQTLGRSATVADIAAHLSITEEEVLEGLEGAQAYSTTSLSTPINEDSGRELSDTFGGDDAGFELTELRVTLGPALASLDEREQKILTLRFYGNLTQTEIADQIGISQMHVSRLLTKALAKLRAQMEIDA
jgi:RNA polymerase sigma-B factor